MAKKKRETLIEDSRQEQEVSLFAEFDSHLDEQAYNQLSNSHPAFAQTVVRMVRWGISSDKIKVHMLDKYRHLWIQTQALMAAIRHLETADD